MNDIDRAVQRAQDALEAHMDHHPALLLAPGWIGDRFDRLYLDWIRARWDRGDGWVRSVWASRP